MTTKPELRDFLEARSAAPVGFSGDDRHVYISSNLPGTAQLYRVPVQGGELAPLTDLAEPVGAVPLPGGDRVLLQVDSGGNERHQIFLLDEPGATPRPLIEEPDWIHWLGSVRDDGQAFSYQCNRRNGTDFDVYVYDLETRDDRLVFDMGGWCAPRSFSPDGRWLSIVRFTERNMDSDLYLVDLATGEVVHVNPHDDDASAGSPAWLSATDFYFATNQDREFTGIARYSLESRTWQYVLEEQWDLSISIDPSRRRALVGSNEDGFSRLRLCDAATLQNPTGVVLPAGGVVTGAEFSGDGSQLAVGFTSADIPGDTWLYDVAGGESTRLTSSPNPVGEVTMVRPELIRFESFDGLSVPAFVFRPAPLSEAAAPVVVQIHGGPEGQSQPSWNPLTQYLVARGYAVVVPNVRGSTGYGRTYHHLDDVRLRLDSVQDLAALHDWLAADPGLDEKRAALYGGSYGGFMVLAGLTFQPERWAAAVDIVGISSFVTFLENTSPWRRKFREREYGSLENDRDFLHEVSPLTHIEKLQAPLFIIHGANDPRVPLSEAEQIAKILEQKGIRHELAVYADEGHGLAKLANRLDAYPRAVDFLDEVLEVRS